MIGRCGGFGWRRPLRPQYRPWRRDKDHYILTLDMWAVFRYVHHAGWRLGEVLKGGIWGDLVWSRELDWREKVKRIMRVAPDQADDLKALAASAETKVLKSFPTLLAFFTSARYDDGEPRTPGWIQVKIVAGNWQVVLKDRDSGLQLALIAPGLDDALKTAELALMSDKAPWEVDPWANGGKRKKK